MKAKQKRTLLILLAVIVLLAAVLAGVKIAKSRAEQAEAEASAAAAAAGVITDASSGYKELSYSNGNATLSFALNDEGQWYWTDDESFPLDQDYITKMINTLSALKPQQTITDGDTLDAYGLSDPAQSLTAISSNGQTTTLALGSTTTDGNSYYMLMNGAETPVYIISDELALEMATGIYDMCVLPDFPALTETQLNTITLAGPVTTVLTASHNAAAAADSSAASSSDGDGTTAVSWRSGGADVTGDKQVDGIVEQILGLSLDACVDYRPSDAAAALCGFDEPDAVITVQYTSDASVDETLTLTIGNPVLDGDGRYLRVNDDATVYRMTADKLDMLMKVSVNGLESAASAAN